MGGDARNRTNDPCIERNNSHDGNKYIRICVCLCACASVRLCVRVVDAERSAVGLQAAVAVCATQYAYRLHLYNVYFNLIGFSS